MDEVGIVGEAEQIRANKVHGDCVVELQGLKRRVFSSD